MGQSTFLFILLFVSISCTRQLNNQDKTLYVALQSQVRSLDPIRASDLYTQQAVSAVYEPVLSFNYFHRPLELEPLLLEAMPTINSHGTIYELHLKKDIFFHYDPCFGNAPPRSVNVDDIIYSWKRLADPRNKSDNFSLFENKIIGLDEWRKKIEVGESVGNERIKGLEKVDPWTLRIYLRQPDFQFLYSLAHPATSIVPHEAVEFYKDNIGNHPVGTGAFVFKEWIHASSLTFLKNNNYKHLTFSSRFCNDRTNQEENSALPFIDQLVFYEISEDQPRWLMLLKGDLDYSHLSKDFFDEVVDSKNLQLNSIYQLKPISLIPVSNPDIAYISFNTEDTILKNKKLRQAMSLAYDRETANRLLYFNMATIAHGVIPPDIDGHESSSLSEYQQYNLEKAKKILNDLGFPNGNGLPSFNYELAATNSTDRQTAEYFKMQMEKIGIKINIISNTFPQLITKVKRKQAQIFSLAWNGDYPDAENFLQLFYSKNISPGSNNSNFKDATFDQLFEQAKKLPPSAARTGLYKKMNLLVANDVPWLLLVHRKRFLLKYDWLSHFDYNIMIHNRFKYFKIDAQKRAAIKRKL